jgi:2-oxoglutarate dehydrogenase E2 component (dihydrolipoamide succinyltransferase)
MGVSVSEGTIAEWLKEVGDEVAYEEPICLISTDKIDTELPSPAAGRLAEILVPVGETVEVGVPLARIEGEGGSEAEAALGETPAPATETPAPKPAAASNGGRSTNGARRYSPVVSRIAAEHGIDLEKVEGTGRGGRVRKQDVLAFLEGGGAGEEQPPLHIESPYKPDEPAVTASTEGLSRMRRSIGEHMKRSLETAATCTTWIEAGSRQRASGSGSRRCRSSRAAPSTRCASTRSSTPGWRARSTRASTIA